MSRVLVVSTLGVNMNTVMGQLQREWLGLYLAETTEYLQPNTNCLQHGQTRGHELPVAAVLSRTAESRCPGGQGLGTRRHVQIPRCGQEGASPAECCHRCLLCLALLIVATTAAVPGPRTVCAAHAHSRQLHLRLRNSSAARPGRRSCSGCRGWTVARPTRNSVLAAVRLYSGPSSQ